jgi:hypothetical protein
MTMDTHDVVSAFLDDEPFAPADLARALSDSAGRQLLLELVALRTLVRDEPVAPPARGGRAGRSPSTWIAIGFLAASVLFGAGSAWLLPPLLQQRHADAPPTPDRVVTFETAAPSPEPAR